MATAMDAVKLTHRGAKFAAHGKGLFLKDVMHDGVWVHPATNQVIKVTQEIRKSIERNMSLFLANGNKVPMPDGHVIDTAANKGFWPGPFSAIGDDVLGIAEPKDEKTKGQMLDGTADAVSVYWYHGAYKDSKAREYEDIFEHVCLTNYPVIGGQRNFISLSGLPVDESAPFFDEAALGAVMVPEEDEELCRALETIYDALRQGAQREINDIMRTPAERLAARLAEMPKL